LSILYGALLFYSSALKVSTKAANHWKITTISISQN